MVSLLCTGEMDWIQILAGEFRIFKIRIENVQNGSVSPPPPAPLCQFSPRVKPPKCEIDYPPESCAEVMSSCRQTATPCMCLEGVAF
jgi:hypothetical protein